MRDVRGECAVSDVFQILRYVKWASPYNVAPIGTQLQTHRLYARLSSGVPGAKFCHGKMADSFIQLGRPQTLIKVACHTVLKIPDWHTYLLKARHASPLLFSPSQHTTNLYHKLIPQQDTPQPNHTRHPKPTNHVVHHSQPPPHTTPTSHPTTSPRRLLPHGRPPPFPAYKSHARTRRNQFAASGRQKSTVKMVRRGLKKMMGNAVRFYERKRGF